MREKKVYTYMLYLATGAEVKLVADTMDKSGDEIYYWLNKECVGKFMTDKIIGYTKDLIAYEIKADDEKEIENVKGT